MTDTDTAAGSSSSTVIPDHEEYEESEVEDRLHEVKGSVRIIVCRLLAALQHQCVCVCVGC